MIKRNMMFETGYYPSTSEEIQKVIKHYTNRLEETSKTTCRFDMMVAYAVIVPYENWTVSGYTANLAFRILAKSMLDTVLVIAPSQHNDFKGVGVNTCDTIVTPIDEIMVDQDLLTLLDEQYGVRPLEKNDFGYASEVQFPFIRYYMPNVKVVELVCGYDATDTVEKILKYVLQHQKYGVVICSNVFNALSSENEDDNSDAISPLYLENDNIMFSKNSNHCAIEALLSVAQHMNLESIILDHQRNFDVSSTVSYTSAVFQEKLY